MKEILLGVLAATMLLASPLYAESIGRQVLNTGPVACTQDTTPTQLYWSNDTGHVVHITRSQIWIGVDRGGQADIVVNVYRNTDFSILVTVGWDHYADPTGLHQWSIPNDMILRPGDGLFVDFYCNWFKGKKATRDPHVHVALNLWYEFISTPSVL